METCWNMEHAWNMLPCLQFALPMETLRIFLFNSFLLTTNELPSAQSIEEPAIMSVPQRSLMNVRSCQNLPSQKMQNIGSFLLLINETEKKGRNFFYSPQNQQLRLQACSQTFSEEQKFSEITFDLTLSRVFFLFLLVNDFLK